LISASNYPEIKGVIMDASFDDVLPLARSKMMTLLGWSMCGPRGASNPSLSPLSAAGRPDHPLSLQSERVRLPEPVPGPGSFHSPPEGRDHSHRPPAAVAK